MTRFAVQFPEMLGRVPDGDFNGMRQEFIRQLKPVLYMPSFKRIFTRGRGLKEVLRQSPVINPDDYDFAFSVGELNRKADVLVHLGQCWPLDFEKLTPPRGFRGLKVWNLLDYVSDSTRVNQLLEDNGVDYVLGYTDHGRYCAFFQKYYPRYVKRCIPCPFGAGKRFMVDAPWEERKRKVIALGSVNLVNEPNVAASIEDYTNFYAHERFTHQWRRLLVEHEAELADVMDSKLPHFPEMKNPHYDAVKMMTSYCLFANDEGLMAFPPARTYEGPAAGAAMISSDHPSYGDLGFRDGVNCVMHRKHDVADFRAKALHYLQRPDDLRRVAAAGQMLVRGHYTHEAVAIRLGAQLDTLYKTGKMPETRFPYELI
jgi:hypothetical protein